MERAIFSFLLVLGFIPALLYASELHSSAVREIVKEKTRLLEQQKLTNMENEVGHTFWRVAGTRKIHEWQEQMNFSGITVDVCLVDPSTRSITRTSIPIEEMVELSPDGKTVEIKNENPFLAITAEIRAGNSSTSFLIPVGCYREL